MKQAKNKVQLLNREQFVTFLTWQKQQTALQLFDDETHSSKLVQQSYAHTLIVICDEYDAVPRSCSTPL